MTLSRLNATSGQQAGIADRQAGGFAQRGAALAVIASIVLGGAVGCASTSQEHWAQTSPALQSNPPGSGATNLGVVMDQQPDT